MTKEIEAITAEETQQNELLATSTDDPSKGKATLKGAKSASKSIGTISPASKSSKAGKAKAKESKADSSFFPQSGYLIIKTEFIDF